MFKVGLSVFQQIPKLVRAPMLLLFLYATPIIPELCPLLVYPYYAGILCAGLLLAPWSWNVQNVRM